MLSLEAKGTLLGVAAALGVLGVTIGLSQVLQSKIIAGSKRQTPATPASLSETVAAAGEAQRGYKLFDRNCAHCHGEDARGDEGPNLHNLLKSEARLATIIKGGVKGEMPAFGRKFTDAEVHALISYLRTLRE